MKSIFRTFTIVIFLWIALALFFISDRIECTPALGEICLQKAWNNIGNIILFNWVKEWETLISGILAIFAAIIGAIYLERQVSQADNHEKERVRKRYLASRATMPLALSKLISYANSSSSAMRSLHKQCRGEAIRDRDNIVLPEFPSIPDGSVSMLRDMIEASGNDLGVWIAGIISRIQVQNARILSIYDDLSDPEINSRVITKYNIEEYIIDSAKIYATVEALFEFARMESDVIPSTVEWTDIRKALRLMGFYKEEFPNLYRIIERRSESNRRP